MAEANEVPDIESEIVLSNEDDSADEGDLATQPKKTTRYRRSATIKRCLEIFWVQPIDELEQVYCETGR